ncbi:unnamed protein product [Lactuca saligna]|uniref:Uncharacterized protein n=1 Tax=Lactuca saligna TaxID=75948 RepID=A0AA35ZJU6_LACSI|nr:unnamed protein product [Lactuca saligna]
MDSLPDSILNDLRKVEVILTKIDENQTQSGYSLEHVLNSSDNINMRSEMMKFVRNVSLQCLNVFPHDHILKEAALVAEEISNTKMNSSSVAITPCRTLAKSLLKSNHQDVHLCGVYARREAAFGNIEYARKVFDMALLSIKGLPWDPKSNASLLFFWYAELELELSNNNSSRSSESSLSQTLHILCCLGCRVKFSQFKSQPSSLQLLRARQGFKEQIRVIQETWIHGSINENFVASICCASLFQELTSGLESGIQILNQSFSMVLPGTELGVGYTWKFPRMERDHGFLGFQNDICYRGCYMDLSNQWRGSYGPNTLEKLIVFGKDMRLWKVIPTGLHLFEARYTYDGYTMDLRHQSCTCRMWMLSGIHYVHGQATIKAKIPRTIRYGKCQQITYNKSSCKNEEVPKDPIPTRKLGRPRKDGFGQPYFDQFPPKRNETRMDGEGTSTTPRNFQQEEIQPTKKIQGIMYQLKLVKMCMMKGIRMTEVKVKLYGVVVNEIANEVNDTEGEVKEHVVEVNNLEAEGNGLEPEGNEAKVNELQDEGNEDEVNEFGGMIRDIVEYGYLQAEIELTMQQLEGKDIK